MASFLVEHVQVLEISDGGIEDKELEQDMQSLLQIVLEGNSGEVERCSKQTFLHVCKTFYY